MKMNRKDAAEKISIELRKTAIARLETEISRLKQRIKEYEGFNVERVIDYFFPFETDVLLSKERLEVRGGRDIYFTTEVAQDMSDLTGELLCFDFNERPQVVTPHERKEEKS